MAEGVTIVDPLNTWIDARAQIGQDTVIEPFTYLHGQVKIGANCRVGAGCVMAGNTGGTTAIVIGNGVCVGPGVVLSAPAAIGDGQSVSPGSVIGGDKEVIHA